MPYFGGSRLNGGLGGERDLNVKLTRRRFIKGVIASSVATASYGSTQFFNAASSPASGLVERLVTLTVNGRKRRVDVAPQEMLADTLRTRLGLTGTKVSCNRGECGACTVLVDGTSYYSCSTLTHSVTSRKITTVEGLQSASGELHPVQQAFVDELAPQCGFCTPGQIMSAVALLNANPAPTRKEAQLAMAGNLCRCGAYEHYLNGVMRAAGQSTGSDEKGA